MPALAALFVGDPPVLWKELGFAVEDDTSCISGVRFRLGHDVPGLSGWTLVDAAEHDPPPTPDHPNGVRAVDHVVLLTPDLDGSIHELEAQGLDLRRIRDAGNGLRQAFFRMGPVILEVVGDVEEPAPRLWGVTFTVDDLDATAAFLGDRLRPAKDAVQPGRRIATLDSAAGATVPIAFMSA